jgi:biotin carboxyl carrier protein
MLLLGGGYRYQKSKSHSETTEQLAMSGDVQDKIPFYIETLARDPSQRKVAVTKSSKLQARSEIVVTALVPGRVQAINAKEGDAVSAGQSVVSIRDTNGQISFGLQRTQIALDSARNTYTLTEEQLKKQLDDARIAYERAVLQRDTLARDLAIQAQKSSFDLANTDINDPTSNSSIQVSKLETDLEKANFDLEAKIKADEQQLENFTITARNVHNDSILLLKDAYDLSDQILWISSKYEFLNDAFESNLWALDTQSLRNARTVAIEIKSEADALEAVVIDNLSVDELTTFLARYRESNQQVYKLVDAMKTLLSKTVAGWSLSDAQIAGWRGQFDGFQGRAQGAISGITAQTNSISSFLASYQDQQDSIRKSIASLTSQIDLSKKQIADGGFLTDIGDQRLQVNTELSLGQAELAVEQAKSQLDVLTTTYGGNLQNIRNQLASSEVSYAEISNNASKFSATTPFKGEIVNVLVDEGQDINPGTPLYSMISDRYELELFLNADELKLVNEGTQVSVQINGNTYDATVYAASNVADKNGNYKVSIDIDKIDELVGATARVEIFADETTGLVPLRAVRMTGPSTAELVVLDGDQLRRISVQIWKLVGSSVEVVDSLPSLPIITSDVDRYNPLIHMLEKK